MGQGGESAIFREDGSGFLKSYTDKFKRALRSIGEDVISKNNTAIREDTKRLKEREKKTEGDGRNCCRKRTSIKGGAKP